MGATAAVQVGVRRRFCLLLVKPSHYDDNGYVIQWMRSPMPSNSLAALYGLAKDCAERRVLGDDVDIDIHAFDEINTRIRPERLAAMIEAAGSGMVMLAGVQSNQFPRALDLARPLRQRGIQVSIGGFHVSGVLSMLNGVDADLDRAKAMGLSLFAGEAEGRLELVLRDADAGALKPLYNYMDDLPGIEGTPIPLLRGRPRAAHHRRHHQLRRRSRLPLSMLLLHHHQRAGPQVAPPLAGRCRAHRATELCARATRLLHHRRQFRPQQGLGNRSSTASFICARWRSSTPASLSKSTRSATSCRTSSRNARAPASSACSSGWRTSTPTICSAPRSGRTRSPNTATCCWPGSAPAVITYAGYILGFPNDTVESIMHDIDVIKRELPVDLLEFFYLTPLPGSEDHLKLYKPVRRSIPT